MYVSQAQFQAQFSRNYSSDWEGGTGRREAFCEVNFKNFNIAAT